MLAGKWPLLTVHSPFIFPKNRQDQAHSLTGGHLGFKCTGFSPGMTMKTTFGAAASRKPHIWTILGKDKGQ